MYRFDICKGRNHIVTLAFGRDPKTLYRMINYTIDWKKLRAA
jgi:hypothetical protein